MSGLIPVRPKIYHIVHVSNLPSIVGGEFILSDEMVTENKCVKTTIGMNDIKLRRLRELTLSSHPGLYVGQCVPFYFCPRSIMLYVIHMKNGNLTYQGGQEDIVHLESDLYNTVAWANQHGLRWAFTLSNAGSRFFEDRSDLSRLGEIDWNAVRATSWSQCKDGKQAEFLVERKFPWELVEKIGIKGRNCLFQASAAMSGVHHRPVIEIKPNWYY
ncbi:DUF4433 domain-containing protein [Gluconacetobacter sp. 1c LMG 22058]|uniref:DUF4433 domain-containing protein n=1 Tax=Gluconacetobacter dulcium TaxID=2729096 RepID=A0A7W4K2U0_9PROT|nr:DUF4433 domain-containing protein [Gluconacetobacter dulcium]MBB2199363.1 DUF4433 domain-containing protein [Gluconacetobacter dulcium]